MIRICISIVLVLMFTLGALYALPDGSISTFRVSSSNSERITLELNSPEPQFESVQLNNQNYSRISIAGANPSAGDGNPELPVFSGMVALPPNAEYSLSYEIGTGRVIPGIRPLPSISDESKGIGPSDVYQGNLPYPQEKVTSSQDAYLRDFRVLSLQAYPLSWDPASNSLQFYSRILVHIDLSYPKADGGPKPYTTYSPAFRDIYEAQILNFGDYRGLVTAPQAARMLIIHGEYQDDSFNSKLNDFVAWKRQKGFEVDVASTAISGSSNAAIKSYIQNRYNNLDTRPDFIVLLGDVTGSFAVPTWVENESGHNGEGDYPYTHLSGDDFLGDAFIGRISAENVYQLGTLFSKIYAYEKNVNIDPQSASWLNRMLVIGDPSYLQYSCYYTAQHICEMAEAANPDYTFIENDTAGFVSTINQGINQGVGFFTYRGYYGVSGWSPDQTFINGRRLPHSVILTCRTGCFAEDALSEEFIRLGTEANPSGGLTCIGMATGGTHTMLNNALISGIMGGIFTHKMRTMGEALLNGRLYLNSIYGVSEPVYTRSLAHWCNLMGDPTIEAWVGIPNSFTVSVPDEIPFGTSTLEVDITNALEAPAEGVCVTVCNPETAAIVAKAFTDASGRAVMDLPTALGSEILLTASQHNFKPYQTTVPINDSGSLSYASHLLIDDGTQESFGNADGLAQAMETIAMNVSLGNFTAEDLQGLSATLSTEHPEVHVITEYVAYPDISAGELASGTQSFLFHLGFNIQPWEKIRFLLDVSDADGQEYHSVFYVDAYNARLAVSNYTVSDGSSGILDPGESSLLMLQVSNASTYPAFELMGYLRSLNDLLAIPDSVSYFGDILPQSQGLSMDGFQVFASDKLVPGMMIPCLLRLFNDHGYEQTLTFNLPIGSVSQNTPLGPDEYGYLIYDDTDTAFPDCPSYDWIEIVPALGGYGTIVHGLSDTGYSGTEGDSNSSHALMELELPFRFPFYGIYYNRITVCVNGFIVFGSTKNGDYRNAHIPGGQGPSPMIAAFWDDLYLPGGTGIYTYDDTENHRFIIQYHNLKNGFDQTSVEDFQVILYDPIFYPTGLGDGQIKIQYKTFNNVDLGGGGVTPLHGNYCTIGIKDHTNTRGLEYTYNNTYPQAAAPLGNERAILITTVPTLYNHANLILNELSISDENGNSILEPGETVDLGVYLSNTGNSDASGVSLSLSSSSLYVTMFTQESGYPDIAAQTNAVNIIPFNFRVAEDCPGNTFLNFQCDVTIDGNSWSYPLSITVYRPEVSLYGYFHSDYAGNYSGNLDPGEEALLVVNFKNLTPVPVNNLVGNISCSEPYITLLDTTQVLRTMLPRAISQLAYRFRISPTASVGDNITIYLSYHTEQMAAKISQLTLKVGYTGLFYDFDTHNGNFSIAGGGWEWGSDQDVGTHSGAKVWGTALGEPYDAVANWNLRSPVLYLGSNYFLEFWHYYDMEYGQDGGKVRISINNGTPSTITPLGGYPCEAVYALGESGFSGLSNWSRSVFDLSAYQFQNVRFYWTFRSNAEVQGLGWYIDDVSIMKQPDVAGLLTGQVLLNGAQIPRSEVWVSTQSGISAQVDSLGVYKLYLPVGTHSLMVSANGYQSYQISDLVLSTDEPILHQDFQLVEFRQVENFSSAHTEDAIQLSWSPPSQPYYPVVGYRVMRKTNAGAFEPVELGLDTSYSEVLLIPGVYQYYVQAIYELGESLPTQTYKIQFPFPDEPLPKVTMLRHNYPNPFNPSTTLSFDLATGGRTKLLIFNLRGQLVRTICDTNLDAGVYKYEWDGRNDANRQVSSGVYFYRLSSPYYNKTRKMLLLK